MPTTRREFLRAVGGAVVAASGCARIGSTGPKTSDENSNGRGKVILSQAMPRPRICLPTDVLAAPIGPKLRLALLGTIWARFTHVDNIATPLIEGYSIIGRNHSPHVEIASLYLDQTHKTEIGTAMAAKYRIPVFKTIADALTLGTGKLAVDGVVIVCEDGAYPKNEKGQKLHPRRQWFEQVVNVFRWSGMSVPVYHDKFFASTWADSEWMYGQSKDLGFPMAAGSSVPLAWRMPPLAFERGVELNEALAVGHQGLESYGYHAIELLQSFAEKRGNSVKGIRSVEVLEGDAAWTAAKQGRWREDLLRSALSRMPLKTGAMPVDLRAADPAANVILIEYSDGFRSCVYMSRGLVELFAFAASVKGTKVPVSTWAHLNTPQRDHFKFLCNHIEVLMRTKKPTIPPERTYLATGAILAAVDSHYEKRRVETPHLTDLSYVPAIW